ASQEHALELIFRKIADSKYLLESLEQADDEDGAGRCAVSKIEILPFMASQEHALELIFRKIADSKYLLESLEQADDEDG
ncbi:hypothetical protein CTI14_68345, partial [Methylobacterium radiotolerans]